MAAEKEKWEGKATAEVRGPTAAEVWPLIEDFFAIHKWLPTVDTCHKLDEGLRYCAGGGGGDVKWCRERLVSVDSENRCLSYELLESNMGFKSYRSTIGVEPAAGDGGGGCRIVWSFAADPVEGLRYGDLVGYIDAGLQGMAAKFQKAFSSSSSSF
ncbi:lachrymatory-factor synthase-like isoform X2 [Andrographis paniculata]|nr:lachrymatory-factor synthase-like isoform X2 [Andrographis paniculata]XP_051137285.1 lachrymatory-factor synthase-like isoform X2 [Andrographis paniculata]